MSDEFPAPLPIAELRQLIGQRARYAGNIWQIIEVLENEPTVILVCSAADILQADQYGELWRHVPSSLSIAVYNADRTINPEFANLEIIT